MPTAARKNNKRAMLGSLVGTFGTTPAKSASAASAPTSQEQLVALFESTGDQQEQKDNDALRELARQNTMQRDQQTEALLANERGLTSNDETLRELIRSQSACKVKRDQQFDDVIVACTPACKATIILTTIGGRPV
jgi:hypothetical protein